jgi:DNA-binding transcriptional LysR family regulator
MNSNAGLGVELFARRCLGLAPTAAAGALLRRVVQILTTHTGRREIGHRREDGRLTVGLLARISTALGDALGRLPTELPDIVLVFVDVFDDAEMVAGILDGSLDVAVQRLPDCDACLAPEVGVREPLTVPSRSRASSGDDP